VLLDSRTTGRIQPGAAVNLPLPGLPPGTTAVLLEVSLVDAIRPGAVTVDSGAGDVTVLRLARAKAMTSATVVVRLGRRDGLRARTEGGGHLLVNLVGAFEPAETSSSGRIVPVPATPVLRLVPATNGKIATVDLTGVPAVRDAGTVAAVLLQISADVGHNGGFIEMGPEAGALDHRVFWSPTAGEDRTRNGFLVVPVVDGAVHLHYQAGSLLTVDLVGYVTDGAAPPSPAGLVVPVQPGSGQPVRVAAGTPTDISVVPPADVDGVPADRVAAVLVDVNAVGDATGAITMYPPDSARPQDPTIATSNGAARQTLTAVGTARGAVRVDATADASVTLALQAVILGG
jgi:hypothetical protein